MTLTPDDPRLLTPGPLTTSHETKAAMLHDWGSSDAPHRRAVRFLPKTL
jgi:2-aminoethylphosphonate-pyruvate transaminase